MSSVVPSSYILRPVRLFSDIVGNEKLSQTKRILSITVASDPVSLHYATKGAFVTYEEAIASFFPPGVGLVYNKDNRTRNGVLSLKYLLVIS